MPVFSYKALDDGGVLAVGELDARTKSEAYQKLIEKKLKPVRIEPGAALPSADVAPSTGRSRGSLKLGTSKLLQFTEELADLLDAGLQLEPALRVIESRQEASNLAEVAGRLRQKIREGASFSAALREHPAAFSDLYTGMVAAGEAAGVLPQILRKQAEYLTISSDMKSKVAAALIYPSIVFGAGILLLVIFMTFLLPQLTSLLSKTGHKLPLVTQLLIEVSEFFAHYWWAILIVAGLSFGSFKAWSSTPAGRASWDAFKLRIPLIGGLITQNFLTQFLHTLSTLASNGVTLLNALTLTANATANTRIKEILRTITLQVGEGASLSRCLKKHPLFPAALVDIVNVGEQTGDIALALQRGATKYDREFTKKMQQMTTLIQPLIILLVAIFVGVIAYSMIAGILTTVSGLRTR